MPSRLSLPRAPWSPSPTPSRRQATSRRRQTLITLAIAVCAGWIVASGVYRFMAPALPPMDDNLRAYFLLDQGLSSQRYSIAAQHANEANALATDPDLRLVADFFIRYERLTRASGIDTFTEANSVSGVLKALLTGFRNPQASVEGLGATVDMLTTDYAAAGKRLDARYQPQLVALQTAIQQRSRADWWYWCVWAMAFAGTGSVLMVYFEGKNTPTEAAKP